MTPADGQIGDVFRYQTVVPSIWVEWKVLGNNMYQVVAGSPDYLKNQSYLRPGMVDKVESWDTKGWTKVSPVKLPAYNRGLMNDGPSAWAGVPGQHVGMMFVPNGHCKCGRPREGCIYHDPALQVKT